MSDATILLNYLLKADASAIASATPLFKKFEAELKAAADAAVDISRAFNLSNKTLERYINNIYSLNNVLRILHERHAKEQADNADRLRAHKQAEIAAIKRWDAEQTAMQKYMATWRAEVAKEKAENAKRSKASPAAATAAPPLSPLEAFNIQLAGGADKLRAWESNMYKATRAGQVFSSQLVTQPITTLKAFTASTNKAAIASEYFRSQLRFLAESRFGTILIWSAIIGGIASAFKTVIAANIEMDSAIRRVGSAFVDTEDAAAHYGEIQRRLLIGAVTYGMSVKDQTELMWELKSAGLSVTETYAGMDAAQKLMMAGAEDLNMASRILAGLYKTFGDEIKGATTEQEKFAEIAGTLAYVNIKSQATIDTLTQSFKYASGIAKSTGVSFNELSSAILVANNRMLFGSTAGTGLANAILSAVKNYKELAKVSGIAFDPNKPLQFSDFLHGLAQNQDLVNKKIGAMGELSESVNVRGLRALLALVQGVKEYDEALGRLNEGNLQEFIDKIASVRMDTLAKQWDRLKEGVKGLATSPEGLTGLKETTRGIANLTEAWQRFNSASKGGYKPGLMEALNPLIIPIGLVSKGFDSLTGKILEYVKAQELAALKKTAAAGDVEALAKLALMQDLSGEKWQKLLTAEQTYQLELLKEGKTFEQQVQHLEDRIQTEKEAIEEFANAQKEREQHGEKLIQLERQKIDLQDKELKNHRDNIKTISELETKYFQKSQTSTLQTLHNFEKVADFVNKSNFVYITVGESLDKVNMKGKQLFLTMKGVADQSIQLRKPDIFGQLTTPAEDIDRLFKTFQRADEELKKIGTDATKVKVALQEWMKPASQILDIATNISKQFEKAISIMSQTTSMATEYARTLLGAGKGRQAEDVLMRQYDEIQRRLLDRNLTEQQRIELLKQEQAIYGAMQAGEFGIYGGRVEDKIAENALKIFEAQLKLQDEAFKQAEEAQKAIVFPEFQTQVIGILETIKKMPDMWKEAADAIEDGLSPAIQTAVERTTALKDEITLVVEQIKNLPTSLPDYEKGFKDRKLRGDKELYSEVN